MNYNEYKKKNIADRSVFLDREDFARINREFLDNIQKKMYENNISYSDLACLTGISASYLYRILKGEAVNFRVTHLVKIMMAMDMEPSGVFPQHLQKMKKKEKYGEAFEYITRELEESEKEFILQVVEQYVRHMVTIKTDIGNSKGHRGITEEK